MVEHAPGMVRALVAQRGGYACWKSECACRACAASEALRSYDGPTAFAITGNHDWIDGLETFQRFIQHKGWLGGWLLPQVVTQLTLLCNLRLLPCHRQWNVGCRQCSCCLLCGQIKVCLKFLGCLC